ncbi:MAG: hypothetical protein V1781_09495 [Bacteroidota bacterium]
MNKSILIISYVFPPYPGIGSRRWVKFAKYLTKKGYEIHVICAKNPGKATSQWIDDVQNERIKIYPIDVFYPKIFSFTNYSKSIFNRIAFRFWTLFFKLFSKGVIYDRSLFWKKPFLRKAQAIISEYKINNVIVTIPPFRLAHHALSLLTFNKNLNLIVDYRDPWTDNTTFQGFENLSSCRLNYEKKIEREVLQKSNYIISTSEQMTTWAKEKLNSNKEKCITICNGYDNDDIVRFTNNRKNEKKILISAGNLYGNLEYLLVPFVKFIQRKEQQEKKFSDKYGFEFYGEIYPSYYSLLKDNNIKSVSFNGFISRKDLNKKYNRADFFLMFTVNDFAFAFNTKFYEYLAYQKPIIHFSNDGAVTQFLETNQLGLGIKPTSFEQDMERLFDLIEKENLNYNNTFDSSSFSLENLTKKVEQLFI